MSYRIVKYKGDRWALLYRLYKSQGKDESRIVRPGEAEYGELGLRPEMALEQARAALKVAQSEMKKRQRDRRAHDARMVMKKKLEVVHRYLPDQIVAYFEDTIIPRRGLKPSAWIAVKRYIEKADLHPSEWFEEADAFYEMFLLDRRSPHYARTLTKTLNEYGWEYCKAFSKPWREIPVARGKWFYRIKKAYKEKLSDKKRHYDCPRIDPSELEKNKSFFITEQYKWIFISLWFGLRPRETNELAEGEIEFTIEHNKRHNFDVLSIYQTKTDKYKKIPILYSEQKTAIEYLKEGGFKKPLIKTIRKWLGPGVRLYSCRKGFVNIMHDKGHTIVEISKWLGHENIETTLRYYWDIQEVVYEGLRA